MQSISSLGSGVLPDWVITQFIETGKISNGNKSHVQPSSLDVLPDLKTIFEVDEFYSPREGEKIETLLQELCNRKVARQMNGNTILSKGKRYLIPLQEKLNDLPYFCRNNPKSSPGRTFLHTRLLTDGSMSYDEIYPNQQTGKHWLLITPNCFNVTLSEGEPVCQLRFFKGSHRLSQKDLDREMRFNPFITFPSEPLLFSEKKEVSIVGSAIGAHVLSVDMRTDIVAYKTKTTDEPINLACRSLDWKKYYDPVYRDSLNGERLLLEPGCGYLFGSLERIKLPANIAGEVSPYVDKYGELRAHFAGYIDPGFGIAGSNHGNSITFEVITHENGVVVRHGQSIGEIQYEYMAGIPQALYQGNYTYQPSGPQLPKYFKK